MCDGCPTEVHAECYCLSNVPAGDWYCDRCTHGVARDKRLRCTLCCRRDEGYGMLAFGRDWHHMVCRRYVLDGNGTMKGRCCFCGSEDGRKVRCHVRGCAAHAHASCAQTEAGYLDSEKSRKSPSKVDGYLYCDVHSKAKALVAANGSACGSVGMHAAMSRPFFNTGLEADIARLGEMATTSNPRGVDPKATYSDEQKRLLAKPRTRVQRWFMMPRAAFAEVEAALAGDDGDAAAAAAAAGGAASSSSSSNSGGGGSRGDSGRWVDGVVGITNPSTGLATVTYAALGGVEECLPLTTDASPLWIRLAPAAAATGGAGTSSSSSSSAGAASGKYAGAR